MSDLSARASTAAIAASIQGAPTPRRDGVQVRLVYDAFDPASVEVHQLDWEAGATLASYMAGLPAETEWMVYLNGQEVDHANARAIPVNEGDTIGLIVIPLGGEGFKSVLRIALQAAAIAAAFIPGVGWAAALAINVGIGLINAFLLTPKPPKADSSEDDKSYGIDGAKNSATENIPYPVIYGEFRTAGNFSDCFTENVGDDQYLYLRTVLDRKSVV